MRHRAEKIVSGGDFFFDKFSRVIKINHMTFMSFTKPLKEVIAMPVAKKKPAKKAAAKKTVKKVAKKKVAKKK